MILPENQNKIFAKLSENGNRMTYQRNEILKIFFEHDHEHLTADKVYEYSKKASPNISIATVYRTIQYLEKADILFKIKVNDKCSSYEILLPDEKEGHPHFVCKKCGKTIGIKDATIIHLLNKCEQAIKSTYDVNILEQNILYYGLCSECL